MLSADGVIDEIRVSKCLRYGPVMPEGVAPVLYSLPTTSDPPPAPVAKDAKEEQLDAERAKLISPLPPATADYTFGADQVHPAWEGMSGWQVRKDYFGKGADGFEAQSSSDRSPGQAAYWRLEKVEQGDYYVGLWVESSSPNMRTEYGEDKFLASAYLNGWPVRFSTTSDPVQVRPGVWLAELQTAVPLKIKAGDEVAFWPVSYTEKQCFLRLALYRKPPARGHGITGRTFGVDCGALARQRLVLRGEIKGSGGDGDEHEAQIEVVNPLPYAVDADVTWKLADYYGVPVDGKTQRMHLEPHKLQMISRKFTASGNAHAYQLDVKSRPAPDFKFPLARPVDMMELSDYCRWEFQPDQSGPATAWNHARKDMLDNRTGNRRLLSLDGDDWDCAYLDGRHVPGAVPGNLSFFHYAVPSPEPWVRPPQGRFGKWFRKVFTPPAWMKGDRCCIEITQVQSEATVFLNGQKVGYGVGALPVLADITKALKPGAANELVICVRGGIATVNPEFVDQYDPDNWKAARDHEVVYHNDDGLPVIKSVNLRTLPEVRVRQSLVVSDAQAGKLHVMTRVENAGDRPRQVTLKFEVVQDGKSLAISLPEKTVTIPGGTFAEVAADADAGELVQWTPHNPALAKLVTTVLEDGRLLDTFDRRFGYRDLKVQGTGFLLNGKPVHFFGACNGLYPHDILEGDCAPVVNRGSYDMEDIWDEIGVPYLYTAWNCNVISWGSLNSRGLWETWRNYLLNTVWDNGSRGGVVGWDLSCETFYVLYTAGKEGQEKDFELLYSGAKLIRDKTWPDWFCMGDGDGSYNGRLSLASYHYWNQYSFGGKAGEGGFTYEPDGIMNYPPDTFFLNGAANVPRQKTLMHMSPDWLYGSCACGSTEDFEFFGPQNGVPHSRFIGDRAAISGACTANEPRGMAWTKLSLEGDRDTDEAIAGCVYWNSFYTAVNPRVSFCMPQQEIRYYSGAKFDRRIDLFDDEYKPGELEFRWGLVDPAGRTVRNGHIDAPSDTGFIERDRVTFDLPEVYQRTRFTLNMEIVEGRRQARARGASGGRLARPERRRRARLARTRRCRRTAHHRVRSARTADADFQESRGGRGADLRSRRRLAQGRQGPGHRPGLPD